MGNTLYRKVGRRYYPVGQEFTGFPADGYWQVVDGRKSLIVPADYPRPLSFMRYTQYADWIMHRVLDRARVGGPGYQYTISDLVFWVLEDLETITAENGGEK